MEDTLSIVIKLDNQTTVMVNMANGKVLSGSVRRENRVTTLSVKETYRLCGYPYVELEEDEPQTGVLA